MKKTFISIIAMALILGISGTAKAQWSLTGNNFAANATPMLGTTSPTNLSLITNGLTRIVVKGSDGSVGIGTDKTTGFKLSVEGKVRAREVFINLDTWADYVFDDTYKLMSISELETYIKKENHLPNVPTTAEATAEPLSIGDTQTLLLSKIEELTLYIIELNNRIEELEAASTKQ